MPSDCCFYVDTNEFLYAAYLQFETFKQTLTVRPRQTMSLLKIMKTLRWRSGDFTGLNDIIERKMMPLFSWVILCLRKYSIVFKRNVCIYYPTVIWTNNTTYIVKKAVINNPICQDLKFIIFIIKIKDAINIKNGSHVCVYLCALHLSKFQSYAGKPWADYTQWVHCTGSLQNSEFKYAWFSSARLIWCPQKCGLCG